MLRVFVGLLMFIGFRFPFVLNFRLILFRVLLLIPDDLLVFNRCSDILIFSLVIQVLVAIVFVMFVIHQPQKILEASV